MEPLFKVGDRVISKVLRWREEVEQRGVVVECYQSVRSAVAPGLEMVAVQWDNGSLARGYLNDERGSLRKEPLAVA